MKFSIAQRFALVLAAAGILAAGLTGYYAYHASRELLVRAAEERLLTATRVLMRQITVSLDDGARNVQLMAGHPRARTALTATGAARGAAEDDLAVLFREMLRTRPELSQIRLIAAADHGIERVRVDRDESGLLRIRGDDLQEKGHLPYVFETLRLPMGAVYLSSPFINRERGVHAGEGRPALHMAAPVYTDSATPIGLIIVNADLNGIFSQLAIDLPGDIGLYLANDRGDFLIHPDANQAFAFDKGKRSLVQDQFPETAALLEGSARHVVTTTTTEAEPARGLVATFIRAPLTTPQQEANYLLGLSQSMSAVLKESDALGGTILRIVVALSVLSAILATLLARAVTRPLNQMVQAVKRFATIQERGPLPVSRHDEIGVLARSFDDMQQQIETHLSTLQNKQLELDHLASHDVLTGLPNRRVFLDRVEHALARTRREEAQLAILFVDLDHFKEINDNLGHAVGDVMLLAVADRMRATVRATDTVARLGGDEFIVLIEDVDTVDSVTLIARKIIESLATPVSYRDHSLVVGASIGIAIYPHDGVTTTEIIASADQAMYRAKLAGRNRYCLASVSGEAATMPIGL